MLNICVMFRNNEDLVRPFFYFLRRSAFSDLRIFVLEQGSEDKTFENLQKEMTKNDYLKRIESNVGISKGRNILLEMTREKLQGNPNLFFLDSDLFIARYGSLENMTRIMEEDRENIGMVFGRMHSFYKAVNPVATGIAFSLINGLVIKKIGKFDEEFKVYFDDSDFIATMNTKTVFRYITCEDAYGVHIWGETCAKSENATRDENLAKDEALFNKKWGQK